MTNTINITPMASLEQVIDVANMWCRNEMASREIQKGQKALRAQIINWLKFNPLFTVDQIKLEVGRFTLLPVKERLTAKKVLEYAKKNDLPIPVMQKMIEEIEVSKSPTLAWKQN